MKKQIPLIALAVFSIVILLSQDGINLVYAVSVISITFATGTTTTDASYVKIAEGSGTNAQAYVVGANAGQAFIWSKPSNSDTITANRTLTGSGSASAVQHHSQTGFIYVATNDKFYKISPALAIAGQFATGQAATTIDFQYDPNNDSSHTLYFCFNDGYGSLNTVTLVPTVLYTDAGANAIFGCSLDVVGGAMYLSGDNIGTASASDLIKISLSTHTQSAGVAIGADFFYGNCVDKENHNVWALESSNARVRKYDSSLNQLVLVTVGTTPRHCSISDDSGARRLYVANEGTNNISIVDIDANVVITTPSVCDTVAGRKLDTFRGFNTTRTFVTCNSNVNSIVLDDTVSTPPIGGGGVACIETVAGSGILDLCFNDTDGNGLPDNGQLGSLGVYRSNTNITSFGSDVFCSFGINTVACTDKNVKTNGVGGTLLAILILISYAFLVSIHIFAQQQLTKQGVVVMNALTIHAVLILVMLIIDTSIAFQFGWIDSTIYFTMIVLMVGLAGFGFYRIARGGNE